MLPEVYTSVVGLHIQGGLFIFDLKCCSSDVHKAMYELKMKQYRVQLNVKYSL